MKCPNCDSTNIKGMQLPLLARGKIDYSLECQECGHKWRRGRPTRTSPEKGKELQEEWKSVKMEPNRLQRRPGKKQ